MKVPDDTFVAEYMHTGADENCNVTFAEIVRQATL